MPPGEDERVRRALSDAAESFLPEWRRRGAGSADVRNAADARDAPVDLESFLAGQHARSFGWALACCGWDRAEAEDVLQSSYLKVLEGRARFAGRSSFATWLFGVIRLTASERRRGRQRQRSWLRRAAEEPDRAQAPPETGSDADADADRLRQALLALPARQREVLHLVFYGELSIREASQVMGVSLGSARRHYERGKRKLRERLETGEPA